MSGLPARRADGLPEPAAGDILGHPRGLWMLLAVTVGLNFAFYGFRAFLAPYAADTFFAGLTKADALKQADLLLAGFGTLTYATAIIGGWIADNVLGEVQALRISLWAATLGLLGLAWPSREGFTLALSFFVLAAGLGIPLTVLVGRNYADDDPRRDAGYTLFYLAINFGAFIAPPVCAAWIGKRFGYDWGFVAAAAGMAVSALIFELRHRRMPGAADRPPLHRAWSTPAVLIGTLALVYPCALLLAHPDAPHVAVYVLMALMIVYFVVRSLLRGDAVQGQRYLAMLLLFVAMVLFWAWSLQGATSLNFFARDHVRAPFDYSWFQSANPLYILVLAPALVALWPWLDRRGLNPSTPMKFGIGLLLVALSYGAMVYAIHELVGPDGRTPWWPLALCYLLSTLGELALSPIGYAMIGKLAAPEDASLAMGGWFFGVGVSYDLSGRIAAMTTHAGGNALAGYDQVFTMLLWSGIGIALVYLLAAPRIVKLMHGVK
ncbi:MAG: peptide MFS transporter [Proteobacteria bacterium]|nr:peptide MFS transporter [Pseudomonadota bacterium]